MEMVLYRKGEAFTVLYDECDHELVSKYKWGVTRKGYVYNRRAGGFMHRLIMGVKNGEFVDHINRKPTDNRRENLRICTHAENSRNKTPLNKTSEYLGVYKDSERGCFRACIRANGKNKDLGRFETSVDAAIAYDRAARFFYGEFSNPNFPDKIDYDFDAEAHFKPRPKLGISLRDLLVKKTWINKCLTFDDKKIIANRMGKHITSLQRWFRRKTFTIVDYEYVTETIAFIEQREKQVAA